MDVKQKSRFERFSNIATSFTGSSVGLICAFIFVLIWGVSGPLFSYSNEWQLVINTATNIITFLMVFLIQRSQNKDSKAMQLKLNELLAANDKASNRMVDIEELTEEELDKLAGFYKRLSRLAKQEENIHTSHSIDAAKEVHLAKKQYMRKLDDSHLRMGTNEV